MLRIIGGTHRKREILMPRGDQTRPTSAQLRESFFNICQNWIEGALFLDLFAGSGAMGLEALSRGAKHVTFVEQDRYCVRTIEKNLENMGFKDRARVVQGDLIRVISHLKGPFDLIFSDPPYDLDFSGTPCSQWLLEKIDHSDLLVENGKLFIEDSKRFAPETNHLENLEYLGARKFGRSTLFHFAKN